MYVFYYGVGITGKEMLRREKERDIPTIDMVLLCVYSVFFLKCVSECFDVGY